MTSAAYAVVVYALGVYVVMKYLQVQVHCHREQLMTSPHKMGGRREPCSIHMIKEWSVFMIINFDCLKMIKVSWLTLGCSVHMLIPVLFWNGQSISGSWDTVTRRWSVHVLPCATGWSDYLRILGYYDSVVGICAYTSKMSEICPGMVQPFYLTRVSFWHFTCKSIQAFIKALMAQ